jgi:ABC-type branched-subunit amino acid transport system substrate-binding protein
MISARSHQQPLSGNKISQVLLTAIGIMAIVLFSSCELFKPISQGDPKDTKEGKEELDPIQGRRVYDPATGTYILVQNAPTDPMDTVIWRDIPSSIEPPIYSTSAPVAPGPGGNPVNPIGVGEGNSQLLSSYNVSVVLPFLSDRYNSIDKRIAPNSTWALQFYNGMEMAFDELSEQGIALNVTVLDSKASETEVTNLTRSNRELNEAHLVIGPYLRSNAAILANKVRSTGGVLVSPHSASSAVSAQNPNYVQVKPTLESHCQAIMQHVAASYKHDQIVLVGINDPNETIRFDYFQREYERLNGLTNTEPLKRLAIDSTKLDMQSTDLKPWFSFDRETVFIVPSWSKETFIYNFLRKLDLDRGQYQQVKVYGMPQWMDYERIDFDYYEKLNVHVSSSVFLDELNPDIRAFKRKYYERYGEIPLEEAFVGYDVSKYFGKMLKQFGTKFQLQLEQNPEQLLHTTFEFQPIITPTTTGGMEFPQVERWENKFVNILRFQNYRFTKAE